MNRTLRRLCAATSFSAVALLAAALPAAAHVTVNSPGATQGGYAKLTFRVPTETESATTKLEVVFPEDAPLAAARVKPHPGWSYTVKTRKPAAPLKDDDGNSIDTVVDSITWTADDGGIKPGEFDEFDISVGPLPEADSMTFKALQTYADGEVVRWIEVPASAGDEPEHPAPTLALAAASGEDGAGHGTAHPTETASAQAPMDDTEESDEADDSAPSAVAWVALGLSVVAVLLGGAAFVAGRRRPTP